MRRSAHNQSLLLEFIPNLKFPTYRPWNMQGGVKTLWNYTSVFWQKRQTFWYFGLWRRMVNLIKTILSAWIVRVLQLYFIFFFPAIWVTQLGTSCCCTVLCQQEVLWLRAILGSAPQKMWFLFVVVVEVPSLPDVVFLKQSGKTKWNVAFVKMHGAVVIKTLTPREISGRCFQRKPEDPLWSHA